MWDPLQLLQLSLMRFCIRVLWVWADGMQTLTFSMFACDKLDDGTRWLKVDYSIDCDGSAHTWMERYAYVMLIMYPIGTPFVFTLAMLSYHTTLSRLQRSEVRAELQKRSNQLRKDSIDQGTVLLRSQVSHLGTNGRLAAAWCIPLKESTSSLDGAAYRDRAAGKGREGVPRAGAQVGRDHH